MKTDSELTEHTKTKLQLICDLNIKAEAMNLRRKLSDWKGGECYLNAVNVVTLKL